MHFLCQHESIQVHSRRVEHSDRALCVGGGFSVRSARAAQKPNRGWTLLFDSGSHQMKVKTTGGCAPCPIILEPPPMPIYNKCTRVGVHAHKGGTRTECMENTAAQNRFSVVPVRISLFGAVDHTVWEARERKKLRLGDVGKGERV